MQEIVELGDGKSEWELGDNRGPGGVRGGHVDGDAIG